MKACTLICNKESGKGIKNEILDQIINKIEKKGYKVDLFLTKKHGDAEEYIKNLKKVDLVLSIGGDGTFNEIVTGNSQREEKLVLSHIPVGTANDLGHMLGLGKNILKNVDKILDGQIKNVDLGIINNHPFAYVAGFGKFINIPYETKRSLKKKIGYFAYLVGGLKEFINPTKMHEIEYKIGKTTYRGLYSLILISNANRIAGFNNIYRDIKLDDDQFEIMFCNINKRRDLIKTFTLLMRTGITNVPGIYCHRSNKVEITFKDKPKENWTIDGEKLEDQNKKYTITINKDLKMLVPKQNIDKLFKK